ncbi:MAG: signal recognition particle-docking protein FtsY [Candidatus Binataceae bacterium]
MSTLQLLMLIAVLVQLPLLGAATLLEFSLRKRRPQFVGEPGAGSTPRTEPAVKPPPPAPDLKAEPQAKEPMAAGPGADEHAEPTAEAAAKAAPTPSEESKFAPSVTVETPPQVEPEPAPEVARDGAASHQAAPSQALAVPRKPVPFEATAPAAEDTGAKAPALAPVVEAPRTPKRIGLGLRKTRENFLARIRAAITGSARLDDIYEGLEEALISADVGVEASLKLVEAVRARLKNDTRAEVIREALKNEIERILTAAERPMANSGDSPLVIMMAGVNGVGKTTTVAKLAAVLKAERGPVLVAAADTFRAAAIDQLQVWCDRVGVDLIKQKQGSDPAAVAFDAVKAAIARKASAVLIDTAGRLQTKVNLMEELKKIARVAGRELPGAPHETWLVLDATTGQNALSQARLFGEAIPLTGVILAKLDSTAKGGVVVGIAERLKLPVRFVGLGEDLEDLRPFEPHEFVEALFSEAENDSQPASGSYAA